MNTKDLCYCGLYCKLCRTRAVYPPLAKALKDNLQQDGWTEYGPDTFEGFEYFWKILSIFGDTDNPAHLCRGGCGDPTCKIRPCAQEHRVEVCAYCPEFPCSLLADFSKRYPSIIKLNERIKEIGLDAWIEEMEQKAAQGLTFKDL